MYDGLRKIVSRLAKEYKLPVRYANEETKEYLEKNQILTTDGFSMEFYGKKAKKDEIKMILNNFEGNIIEIMTHPALLDEDLINISSYNIDREKELEVLTDKGLIKWLEENDFQLIGYNQLKEMY